MTDHNHELIQAGEAAAKAFDDFKEAEAQMEEAFGKPYKAARKLLQISLAAAFADGHDLSHFKGDKSRFKFHKLGAHIIVECPEEPTDHESIDRIDEQIIKAEARLKELKSRRKAQIEKLAIRGDIDMVPQVPALRFKQIAKA